MAQVIMRYRLLELLDKIRPLRTWTNKAHLTLQNVDHLWNLIDSQFSDDCTNPSHTRIIFCRPNWPIFRLSILSHRAKFEQNKPAIILAHSLLSIKNRPSTFQHYRYRRHQP